MRVIAYADGACLGAWGPCGAGAALAWPDGDLLAGTWRRVGFGCSTTAEYQGLILAMEMAREIGATAVEMRCDCEVVVKQIKGQCNVRSLELRTLCRCVRDMMARFREATIVYVPRIENVQAHMLAGLALKVEKRSRRRREEAKQCAA